MKAVFDSDFFREHKEEIGIAAIALILCVFNLPRFFAHFQSQSLKQDIYKAGLQQMAEIEAADMLSEEANLLAIERIERGCFPIFELGNSGSYIALTPGQAVIKGNFADYYAANPTATKDIPIDHLMPAGMCVADPYGNTAMLRISPVHERPVATDVLTTTDEQAIEKIRSQVTNADIPQLKGGSL